MNPDKNNLRIIYSDNRTGHKDLFLEIDALNLQVIADTYYFTIIDNFEPEEAVEVRVKHSLALLLQYWLEKIDSLNESDICHLPFDFSDQYTGCIYVLKIDNSNLKIFYGYSLMVEGWNVDPLHPGDYSEKVTDFQRTSGALQIEAELLKKTIRSIQERFNHQY